MLAKVLCRFQGTAADLGQSTMPSAEHGGPAAGTRKRAAAEACLLAPHCPWMLSDSAAAAGLFSECQVMQEKEAPAQKRRRLNGSRKVAQDEHEYADAGLEDEEGDEGYQVALPLGVKKPDPTFTQRPQR